MAYAHVVLTRIYISRRRRRSFFERPTDAVVETAVEAEQPELRTMLLAALAALRPADRAVLVLRYLLDRSVEQVAADLDKTPAAVRTHSKRALERLRTVLGATQLHELLAD